MYARVVEILGMNEWYHITLCPVRGKNMMRSRVEPFVLILSGTAQGVGLGGSPPPTFPDGKIHFFYFGYPNLSLTTQTRFSNLTVLNTHKQRTDKLCLVAVANEFVALNDNRRGNFGSFRELIRLKNVRVTTVACVGFSFKVYSFKFWSNVGVGCNLLFYITIGSFRCIYTSLVKTGLKKYWFQWGVG